MTRLRLVHLLIALVFVLSVAAPVSSDPPVVQAAPNNIFRGDIRFGQTVTGSIAPGGFDTWRFNGNQGWRVVIEMWGFDTYLYLRFNNTQVASDDDGRGDGRGGSRIIYDLPSSGTYTIVGAGYWNSSGSYNLSLQCGNFGCINGTTGGGGGGGNRRSVDSNPYQYPGECTYFAEERMHDPDATGLWMPNFGNARDWRDNAPRPENRWTVGTNPEVNSVIVMQPGNYWYWTPATGTRQTPIDATYGHVAWVDLVCCNNNWVHVRDRNSRINGLQYGQDGERWFWIPGYPVNFIYSSH